jgi:hypothetical protein
MSYILRIGSGVKKAYTKPVFTVLRQPPSGFANRRRSKRVVLRVALIIKTCNTDAHEHALTLVVNAHGGLLESSLSLEPNQEMTLVNPRTGKTASARVVRCKRSTPEAVTMAFEFQKPAADFWPITFPPEDWEGLES